jgi:oligopeptide transport system substrate-binding protein
VEVVSFNTGIPPFDNPLVRKAFASSIDRDALVQMAAEMGAVDPSPATTIIPPQTLGRDLYRDVGINFDPAAARRFLAQAGYEDPAAFPKVTLVVNSDEDMTPGAHANVAKAMAEMWRTNLGVSVDFRALDTQAFAQRISTDPPGLIGQRLVAYPGNDPSYLMNNYTYGAKGNPGHFSNANFDLLIQGAAKSHTPAIRQASYIEAERILCETEVGALPLYHAFVNMP